MDEHLMRTLDAAVFAFQILTIAACVTAVVYIRHLLVRTDVDNNLLECQRAKERREKERAEKGFE